jgi:hypothetical protein
MTIGEARALALGLAETAEHDHHYRWRIRTRLPERFGEPCRITARGALNSIRVEFADGFWCITSRWSVRRMDAPLRR